MGWFLVDDYGNLFLSDDSSTQLKFPPALEELPQGLID